MKFHILGGVIELALLTASICHVMFPIAHIESDKVYGSMPLLAFSSGSQQASHTENCTTAQLLNCFKPNRL